MSAVPFVPHRPTPPADRGRLRAAIAAVALASALSALAPPEAGATEAQGATAIGSAGQDAPKTSNPSASRSSGSATSKTASGAVSKSPRNPSAKSPSKAARKTAGTTTAGTAHASARKVAHHAPRGNANGRAAGAPAATGRFAPEANPQVRDFIDQLAAREGFDRDGLAALFRQVAYRAEVTRLIAPPPPGFRRSWQAYRARFLDSARIAEGVRFMRENRDTLQRAADTWGVPAEIVAGIIGVETFYGRITGEFRVVDALATLAFEYPPRAEFFREELEQFLLYARENRIDPLSVRGSFAGAIGLPQFMPGSIRRYAVDFDDDARIDLRSSAQDAIGSVARFLASHGWTAGQPTHFDATIAPNANLTPLIEAGIEPRFTVDELAGFGVAPASPAPPGILLALVDLPNGDAAPSYYLGARNFYAITRYNRSSFYAMAVIELARALAAQR